MPLVTQAARLQVPNFCYPGHKNNIIQWYVINPGFNLCKNREACESQRRPRDSNEALWLAKSLRACQVMWSVTTHLVAGSSKTRNRCVKKQNKQNMDAAKDKEDGLEREFELLCQDLNMDSKPIRIAWNNFLRIKENYSLEVSNCYTQLLWDT